MKGDNIDAALARTPRPRRSSEVYMSGNPFDAAVQRPVAATYTVSDLLADCRDMISISLIAELCEREAEVIAHLHEHRATQPPKETE